jgi:uncharacterized protein (TIGR03083 family)
VDHWDTIAAERRALADQFATLSDEQWTTPSLCGAWTVREVLAHLVVPHVESFPSFLVTLARCGFSFERANVAMAARQARRPVADLIADLRRHAEGRFTPPGLGVVAPLTDVLVHGQDVRVPLGLPDTAPVEAWVTALEFAATPKARLGFVARPLPAVRWTATDAGTAVGDGPVVQAPAAALVLAMLGRDARAAELSGPGAAAVDAWLRQPRTAS